MKTAVLILLVLFYSRMSFAWNRVVTLNPMIAEWTAEIIGKDEALKIIVGTSEFSHYPEYLKQIETIGPYPQVQIEKIVSLKPDLIIASEEYNRKDQIQKLKKLGLNVSVLPAENFNKMEDWISELARIFGIKKDSNAVRAWKKELSALRVQTKRKAFFQIQFQPLITAGSKSFLTEAFKKIGYKNIFDDIPQSYPKISKEAVLMKKPEEILLFEMVKNSEDLEKIKKAWGKIRVRVISGDDFSRCSLRLLKGLKKLQVTQ